MGNCFGCCTEEPERYRTGQQDFQGFRGRNDDAPHRNLVTSRTSQYRPPILQRSGQSLDHGSEYEDGFQARVDPQYVDYRTEAQLHYNMKKQYLSKAAEARKRKQWSVVKSFTDMANEQCQQMEKANNRAAAMIIERNNAGLNCAELDNHVIDIHGLHVSEAVSAVENLLAMAAEEGWPNVSVITGRGLHSQGGKAKLKPAILNYLKTRQYSHELVNEGRVIVYLD